MRQIIFIGLLLTSTLTGWSQFSGPNPATAGQTYTYSFDNGNFYTRARWVIQEGSLVSNWASGTTYFVSVTWNTGCSTIGTLTFMQGSTSTIGVYNVTVSPSAPPAPVATFSISQGCQSTTITWSGTPPGGVGWYWQDRSDGTDLSYASPSYVVTTSKNYYLRAYACGVWSDALGSTHVVVINPGQPSASAWTICGTGTVRFTGTPGSQSDVVQWFTTASGGSPVATGNTFDVWLSSSTTYYAGSYNSTYGCASATRVAVTGVVNPIPSTPSIGVTGPTSTCEGSYTTTILTSNASSGIQWYKDGSPISGATSQNYYVPLAASSTGSYSVIQSASGCTSAHSNSIAISIGQLPPGGAYISPQSFSLCGSNSVTVPVYNSRVGANYRLQSDAGAVSDPVAGNGGTLSITSYTITSSRSFVVQAVNPVGGCATSLTGEFTVTVNAVPPTPVMDTPGTIAVCEAAATIRLTSSAASGNQWYFNGSPISGATSHLLDITRTPANSGNYTVMQTSAGCNSAQSAPKPVTIYANPWTSPTVSPATTNLCGSGIATVTITGSQSGVNYQLFNGSTALSSTVSGGGTINLATSTLSASTTITVRATDASSGCFVTLSGTASATVNPIPVTPTVTHGSRCGSGTVNLSAASGTHGNNIRWYTASTGGTLLATSTSYTTGSLASTTNYWAASYNTTTGCESPTRTLVTATVNSVPANPGYGGQIRFGTGPLTLTGTGTSAGGSYKWYNGAGTYQITALTYPVPSVSASVNNYMYLRAVSSAGCESGSVAINVVVYPVPVVSAPQNYVVKETPVTLDAGAGYDTYTWRNSSNTVVGTIRTLTTAIPSTYTVTVTKTGATGVSNPFILSGSQFTGMNKNYVVTNTTQIPGITDPTLVQSLSAEKVAQQVAYFDGLGRPSQTVSTQASVNKSDLIAPVVYDAFGREAKKYLPVVTGNTGRYQEGLMDAAGNYLVNIYNNAADKIADDARPFSETVFEASPLNRPEKDFGVGLVWSSAAGGSNKPVQHAYQINKHGTGSNTTEEKIIAWNVNDLGMPVRATLLSGFITSGGYFDNGQLSIKSTKDEEGNEVREYTDKLGKVVLKKVQATVAGATNLNDVTGISPGWALTYYVYDDLGNLRYVFPPELSKILHTNADTYPITTTDLDPWAFQYRYDDRKRMIEKKVPGAGWVYMVYDKRDRLVLTQDANQRSTSTKYWTFTKYDVLNRPILTGIYVNAGDRTALQTAVNAHYSTNPYFETFSLTGAIHGYSNVSFPPVNNPHDYLTVTYYDNYDFRSLWPGNYAFLNENLSEVANGITYQQPAIENLRVVGQVTGTKIKVLDGGVTGGYTWLKSMSYYDDKYRVVQTLSDNYKGGTDRVTNVFDFVGKVLESKLTHVESDVSWRDVVSLRIEGNKLTAISGPPQYGFGAASVQQLAAGQDGWFEFTVTETNTSKFIGFNDSNSGGTSNSDINYAFQLYYSTLYIQENSAWKATVTGLVPGDVLRMERIGTTISFKRNGIPITTSTITPSTTALFIDNTFHLGGNTIAGVRASFATTTQTISRRFEYDHAGRLLKVWHNVSQKVIWDNLNQVALGENGDLLYKTGASGGLGGADSKQIIPAGLDGWVETVAKQTNLDRMVGLSYSTNNTADQALDFCIFLRYTGAIQINEGSISKGTFGTYAIGDRLKVSREGNSIRYYKNDVLIYTSMASSIGQMKVDSYFSNNGSNLYKTMIGVDVLLTLNEYNELGQLVDKKLHSTVSTGTNAKQSVDYRYNIRGWLVSMNNAQLVNDGQLTNDDTNDLFGMNLTYNTTDPGLGNSPLYNGNISAITWSNHLATGPIKQNGYTYTYDPLNRIKTSSFKEKNTAWVIPANSALSETGFNYDLNGNITTLQRNDKRTSGWMDNLAYTYSGNQLLQVTDTGDDFAGFIDGQPGSGNDYKYDDNGNMTHDLNKGIGTSLTDAANRITYNYLNLPETVTKGNNSIRYIYDAGGRKLAQVTTFGGQQKQVDYSGEFQYENDQVQFISHEEGRIAVAANKTIFTHAGDGLTNITAVTSTLAAITQNGQTYIRGTANGTTVKQGMFPIGGTIAVQAGEQYRIRAKGYRTGVNAVHLYIRTNGIDLNWPGGALANGTVAEAYTEQIITIPTGHTSLQAGVVWNTVTAGQQFFLNEFEIVKLTANTTPEYQYHLKDHLGNVRLTFTSKDETETNTATLEPANANTERGQFLRYDNAKLVNTSLFDRTNGSAPTTTTGYAQRLNGSANEKYGLAKSLSVMPGDVINAEVYAKYVDPNSSNWTAALTTLMSQITANTAGVVVDGVQYTQSTASFPAGFAGLQGTTDNGAPRAYLNWLVFDRNYVFITGGFKQITTAARETGTDVAHERIFNTSPITITQPGYVYIYLSNESLTPVEVYFDDLKVTHTKSPVIQQDDYYPFGLTFNSYRRENSFTNKFVLFQEQEHIDDLALNWDSFKWRNHQSDIGRFFNIDPLAEKYYYNSPYAFSENKVTNGRELEGLEWRESTSAEATAYTNIGNKVGQGTSGYIQEVNGTYYTWTGGHESTYIEAIDWYQRTTFTAQAIVQENGVTVLGADGTVSTLVSNDNGMVELPEQGTGFVTHNRNDVTRDGTVQQDQWGSPANIAKFMNAAINFYDETNGSHVSFGDLSTPTGSNPYLFNTGSAAHVTHSNGNASDWKYPGANGINSASPPTTAAGIARTQIWINSLVNNGLTSIILAPSLQGQIVDSRGSSVTANVTVNGVTYKFKSDHANHGHSGN